MTRVVVACLLLAACGAEDTDLVLALEDGGCSETQLQSIRVVSVEVYGVERGDFCMLAKRCLFDVDTGGTLDGVADALRAATPPLVDVDSGGAQWVAIIGHTDSCFAADDYAMQGVADMRDGRGGILPITLSCDALEAREIPFCP